QGYLCYLDGDWLDLGLLVAAVPTLVGGAIWLLSRLNHREPDDPELIREKVGRLAFVAELRLALFAPADAPPAEAGPALDPPAARASPLPPAPRGRALAARRARRAAGPLPRLPPPVARRPLPRLNVRELACLWHLPRAGDDVPLLERAPARRRLPLPATVASG